MILIINAAGLCPSESNFIANKSPQELLRVTEKIPSYNWNLMPTSAAAVVGYLRNAGFPTAFCDLVNSVSYMLSGQLSENDFSQWLLQDLKTPLMKEYLWRCFNILPAGMEEIKLIGISVCHHFRYPYALSLAKELHTRFPGIPICLGGTYITLSHHSFPRYISFVVKGHGGGPICHLAHHVMNHTPLDPGFPGLYQVVNSQPPGDEKNQEPADSEALPDFTGLVLSNYLSYNIHHLFFDEKPFEPYLSLEYRTAMGCTNKCSFCTGKDVDSLQFKSPKKVIADLEQLELTAKRYSNGHFCLTFLDLAINNSLTHLNHISDGIIESGINIKWLSYAKCHNMPVHVLEKLQQAGCKGLFWGAEAATSKMVKLYNKPFRPEEAEELIIKAAELKICNVVSLIYNGPGETDEDFNEILKFIARLSRYNRYVLVRCGEFRLLEDSDFNRNPAKYDIEVTWTKKDPLYYIFTPTVEWKEKGADWNRVTQQREMRKREIESLVDRLWRR